MKTVKIFLLICVMFMTFSWGALPVAAQETDMPETAGMFMTLKSGGSSDVQLNVEKEKMKDEYGIESLAEFQSFFGQYIRILNEYSDDMDVLNIHTYEETNQLYRIEFSTRRLDKIGGLGSIYYRLGSTYSTFVNEMETLESYYEGVRGRVTYTVYPRIEGEQTQRTCILSRVDNSSYVIKAQKYGAEGLQTVDFSLFAQYLGKTKDRIVTFNSTHLLFTESITIELDGELQYASTEGVEVIDQNTIRLLPHEAVTSDGETIKLWLGYFVYKPNISPFAIGCICVAAVVIIGIFIWCGIRYAWFTSFARRFRKSNKQ